METPVELHLDQPLHPHIHVPPAEPTKKIISTGVDKYGEPTVEITSA